MQLWRFGPALAFLVPSVGCKDDSAKSDTVSQALAQAASAQAMASAAVAQSQPGVAAKAPSADDPSAQALAAMGNVQAMASALMAESQTRVAGHVRSTGGDLGTWDIALNECLSGEVNGFYGADFFASRDSGMTLRYVHDEAVGDVMKVAYPKKDEMLVLNRTAQCSVFEGSIEKMNVTTGTTKGHIRHVSGHVKFDCTVSAGKGHVSGDVTFSHCH